MPERLRLLAETGIDAVLVLPFDAALANLRAREFVEQILVDRAGRVRTARGRKLPLWAWRRGGRGGTAGLWRGAWICRARA